MKIFVLIITTISFFSFGNRETIYPEKDTTYLRIDQTVSLSYVQYSYILNEGKFIIKEKSINKKGVSKEKRIYAKQLNDGVYKSLKEKIKMIMNLDKNKYITPVLDGVRWKIKMSINDVSKELVVQNYDVPEVKSLFEGLNKLIPDNKPSIYPLQ